MSAYSLDDFRRERARRRGKPYHEPRRAPSAKRAAPRGRRESWRTFVERLVASCRARLAVLEAQSLDAVIACPWGAVFGDGQCLHGCKCGGIGKVTVGLLVEHYRGVLAEYGATP